MTHGKLELDNPDSTAGKAYKYLLQWGSLENV